MDLETDLVRPDRADDCPQFTVLPIKSSQQSERLITAGGLNRFLS